MNEHDELTDTCVIRFLAAQDQATECFVVHFIRDLKTDESADIATEAA